MAADLCAMLERRIDCHAGRPRRRERKVASQVSPRIIEVQYRRDLVGIAKALEEITERHLFDLLRRLEPEYVKDAFHDQIGEAFAAMRAEIGTLEGIAAEMAERHISTVNRAQRRVFFNRLSKATAVDLEGLVSEEGLGDLLGASVEHNIGLIKSIPAEHFAKLESLVFRSTIEGIPFAKRKGRRQGLQDKIQELFDVTENRAKFIARDQTAKLNADLFEARNRNLGLEEYIWRALGGKSGDGRNRKTHLEQHGKRHRWDTPPNIGGRNLHPGQDYQCRCTAESLLPASEKFRKRAA